jgi:hypothetical protein
MHGCDRRGVDLIPQHTAILLKKIRVPAGTLDNELHRGLTKLHALQTRGTDERE